MNTNCYKAQQALPAVPCRFYWPDIRERRSLTSSDKRTSLDVN